MEFDFNDAIQAGISAAINREKNIAEIDNLLLSTHNAIFSSTENKVGLNWRLKTFNTLGMLANLSSIPLTDVKIEQQEKEDRILYVYQENDPSLRHDLTVLVINPNGYPCEMNVNGNKLIAHDITSLAENIKKLLSSAFFGQKVRELMENVSN